MEGYQNNSIPRDHEKANTSETSRPEDALSAEQLQRYLKGLGSCKKQRHRSCLSQELHKLISS